jgi:hypothetical protein
MAPQLTAAQPARARTTHWMTEALVVAMAMSAAVVVAWAITGVGAHSRARTDSGAATAWSRLSDITSHNARYQASLIALRDRGDSLDPMAWTVAVRTASGVPVEGAALRLEGWMPDDAGGVLTHPRVTGYLGQGRYRVEGLRFDRRGWWNVKLAIASSSGTDSLAFNVLR